MSKKAPVIIIGAGISGLAAGITLREAGQEVLILESDSAPGGRVRTDIENGFRLDRGFQVFLKSYPEAQRFLDYPSLDFRPFMPGARVLLEKGNFRVMDPIRSPKYLFETLLAPIGSIFDKIRMLGLRLSLMSKDLDSHFLQNELTTLEYLRNKGFSEKIIRNFFNPFMGGVFLENELKTSSRMFEFVYHLMGMGDIVVPAFGMQEIPSQMANRLGFGNIRFNEKVLEITEQEVRTNKGVYPAHTVFFAGGNPENYPGIWPESVKTQFEKTRVRSALTLYFTSTTSPVPENLIVLNPSENQMVNTLAVMNLVSEDYSPNGQYLIAITLKDSYVHDSQIHMPSLIKKEMTLWFPEAAEWSFLKLYYIPYALPDQDHCINSLGTFKISENRYLTGDFLLNGSINAAMKSGRLAAEEFLKS